MSGLGIFSLSKNLGTEIFKTANALHKALKQNKGAEQRLERLFSQYYVFRTEFDRLWSTLETMEKAKNQLAEAIRRHVLLLAADVQHNIDDVDLKLSKLLERADSQAYNDEKMKKELFKRKTDAVRTILNIDSIVEQLSKAEELLAKAVDKTTQILQLVSSEQTRKTWETSDEFVPFFDKPLLPNDVVLDFDSEHSPEARLLRAVSKPGNRGASALGSKRIGATHGMGGVGKTTALRAICHRKELRTAFSDGVCFMEFGQNANDAHVRGELQRCLRNFGGKPEAQKVNKEPELSKAFDIASAWFRERAVLFVCDDLWPRPDHEVGYLTDLRRLLRDSSSSALLISTRDRNIAESVEETVTFEELKRYGPKARQILGTAAFKESYNKFVKNWHVETEFRRILDVCAGLPLALSIAGNGIKAEYKTCKSVNRAVRIYEKRLQQRPVEKRTNLHYPEGLRHVVEASLMESERWGHDEGRNLDMKRLFKSLCVLEKQSTIPEIVLTGPWNVDLYDAMEIASCFYDLCLVKRELQKSELDDDDDDDDDELQYGVRLHDLVLVICQDMAKGEEEEWHSKIVDSYSRNVSYFNNGSVTRYAWWELHDDGYASSNLSRHLATSRRWNELEDMVCDVRWSIRRINLGGWPALSADIQHLSACLSNGKRNALQKLHIVLMRSWLGINRDQSLFAFYVFGHLTPEEREEEYIAPYLSSIISHFPVSWLLPLNKCIGPRDGREKSLLTFDSEVKHVDVLWRYDRMLITCRNEIRFWSLSGQVELFSIQYRGVSCAVLSPSGKLIISGSRDGEVRIWDTHSGNPIGHPLVGHEGEVTCLAVSSDSRMIVSGSEDMTIRRWKASSGEQIGEPIIGHESGVSSVSISGGKQGNETVIVSGSSDCTVRRWRAIDGFQIDEPLIGHEQGVTCVQLSADGSRLVSGSMDETIRRWDMISGKQLGQPLHGHSGGVQCVALNEDATMIVSGSTDNTVWLWDAQSGKPEGKPMRGHDTVVISVAIRGNKILSASSDRTIRQWGVRFDDAIIKPLGGHNDGVNCLAINSDGTTLVSAGWDNTLLRWDARSGMSIGEPFHIKNSTEVSAIVISRDSNAFYITASGNGNIRRWNTETGVKIGETIRTKSHITCMALGADETYIVTGSKDNIVRRWDIKTGALIGKLLEHRSPIGCVALSNDEKMIVSGCNDGLVNRWNTHTGTLIGNPLQGHTRQVTSVALSRDDKLIVSVSSADGNVQWWDAATGEKRTEIGIRRIERYSHRKQQLELPNEVSRKTLIEWNDMTAMGLQNGCVAVCKRRLGKNQGGSQLSSCLEPWRLAL